MFDIRRAHRRLFQAPRSMSTTAVAGIAGAIGMNDGALRRHPCHSSSHGSAQARVHANVMPTYVPAGLRLHSLPQTLVRPPFRISQRCLRNVRPPNRRSAPSRLRGETAGLATGLLVQRRRGCFGKAACAHERMATDQLQRSSQARHVALFLTPASVSFMAPSFSRCCRLS